MLASGRTSLGISGLNPTRQRTSEVVCRRRVIVNVSATSALEVPKSVPTGTYTSVKRLIMLRHADSESGVTVRDHERPISELGKEGARAVATKLKQMGWMPDLILASNSRRTQQTLEEMSKSCGDLSGVNVQFLGSLYTVAALDGQTRSHLQECILDVVNEAHHTVMCIGHNKGWEEAATSFAKTAVKLGNASAALLQIPGSSWSEVLTDEAEWQLVQVVSP